jgi:hypothetical protein
MLAPVLSALALALAAPARIAVLPIVPGEGVSDKTAAALTEALAGEVRRRSGAEVITQREINTVLSLERQKAMMGCSSEACMAELGGALGAERLLNGDVARVGESLLVHLRLVEVAKVKVAAQSDRRFRKGTLDDVLDALPAMVGELFEGTPKPPPAQAQAQAEPPGTEKAPENGVAPGPKPAAPRALPPPWAEEPERSVKEEDLAKLSLWEDGDGHYIALNPNALDELVFWGDAKKLQRVIYIGGAVDTGQQKGSFDFWDPRVTRPGADFRFRPEGGLLYCGRDREIPFKPVPAMEAKKILARAELLVPRWRRAAGLLARDDQGVYFYVDRRRKADGALDTKSPDWRLYVGRKGALALVELVDVVADDAGFVFVTSGGRFVARRVGQKFTAEWATSSARLGLTWLETSDYGPFIYGELGVYAGQQLGTPCDGRF